MQSLKKLLKSVCNYSIEFSDIEKQILHCVRSKLTGETLKLWDVQVNSINKIQRLPGGVEVDFYRMKWGRPTFNSEDAFLNTKELQLAKILMKCTDRAEMLSARIWCVNGFLFSIEYDGDANYFSELCGHGGSSPFLVSCELTADLNNSN